MQETLIHFATLERSIDQLSLMAQIVKRSFEVSLKALFESNSMLAYNVIDADKAINSYEIDIDNITYKMLTNVTIQEETLRAIVSIQKINPMLERIGDHAVNIAESAINIAAAGYEAGFFCLPDMGDICKAIFSDALNSFFSKDPAIAREVLGRDEKVDAMNRSIVQDVQAEVIAGRVGFEIALDIIRVSKNLERIADLSMNIAEETVFAVIGKNIKHAEEPVLQLV